MIALKHSRQTFPVFVVAGAILLGLLVPANAALSHRNQAARYYNQPGGMEKALEEFLKSIELQEENHHTPFKNSSYYWGYVTAAEKLNQPKDAAVILLKAINIWPEEIELYVPLCNTYRQLNDPVRADKYQDIALDIFNKKAAQLHKSNEYHFTLAQLYERTGAPEKAFEEYQKAVTSGEEARRYNRIRHPIAESAYYKGWLVAGNKLFQWEKSLKFLEQAFELFPDSVWLHQEVAGRYNISYKDYERAEEHYRKALEIIRIKPDPDYERRVKWGSGEPFNIHFVVVAVDLANCYIDEVEDRAPQKMQANLDQAYTLLKEAWSQLEKECRQGAMPASDTGATGEGVDGQVSKNYQLNRGYRLRMDRLDDYVNMLSFYKMSILISLARISGDFPEYKGHNPNLALEYALQAYRLDTPALFGHLAYFTISAGVLGVQYLNLGQYDNAIKYLKEHQDCRASGWYVRPDAFTSHLKLAQAYELRNKTQFLRNKQILKPDEEAAQIIDEGILWTRWWTFQQKTDQVKVGAQGRKWRQLFDYGIRLNLKLGYSVNAFRIMEKAKARATLDLLAASESKGKENTLGEMEKEKALLVAKIDEVQQQVRAEKNATNGVQLASLQRSLTLVADKVKSLRENINNCQSEISSAKYMAVLSLQEVQEMLGAANATLIEYWDTNYVAVVSKDVFVIRALDKPLDPDKVDKFREAIVAQASAGRGLEIEAERKGPAGKTDQALPLAKELYDILIRPFEGQIKTERVLIAPDGALNFLPFQALHDGQQYFIEQHSVDYIPSAGVFKYCIVKRKKLGGKALVLGNPNLQETKYKLAYAEEEAKAIAGMFPGAKVLLGNDANEKAVQLLGGDFDVLHFACHGTINPDKPMLSCLRLAPDKDNDGYLHAGELFNLNLNASLVTLSACESGLGKVTLGSDVLGLTRAMMFAGTPSVVASLWKVDDAATAGLMVDFYQGLKSKNKDEALRDAQVRMIKAGQAPFYWAAFCLYGDYM